MFRFLQFKEFIMRLEGSERTLIPKHVINACLGQCAQYDINPMTNPELVTLSRMREFLSSTGYSSFFENIPNIISILTHAPSHRFSSIQKEQLNAIFLSVQGPYEKHKGRRKNFLSYAYITYKLCELLNYNEFLPLLRLLDHRNLLSADCIWRKICTLSTLKYTNSITT